MLYFGIVVAFVLLATGAPIFVAFGLGGLILALLHCGLPPYSLAMMFFESIDSFILLAIPLFVLAGNIMVHSGMGKALVQFLTSFVGRIPGGVGVSTIFTMAFVGALTGTAYANLAIVGLIMFPAMLAAGYDKGYSGGLLCASSNLGNLIPPSITFVIYGFLTGTSVAQLFMAGIVPGLIMTALLSGTAVLVAKRRRFPLVPTPTWTERKVLFKNAIPGLIMPVIVLGGIYGGIFTATEAAAVACVYALVAGFLIYRGLSYKAIWACLSDTTRMLGYILVILAAVFFMGKVLYIVGLPKAAASFIIGADLNPLTFLLLLGAVFVTLGCIMDMMPMLVIVPIILPCATALGIDPLQLGVIFVIACEIGGITPPAAQLLFVTSGMFDVPAEKLIPVVFPFVVVMGICMVFAILFPEISCWLPGTIM